MAVEQSLIHEGKTEMFSVVALDHGNRLSVREQVFISSFLDTNRPGNFAALAREHDCLRDGLKLEITFPDGRKAGLLLKALKAL